MRLRLRLLPVVVLGAALMLSVKLGQLWNGADAVFGELGVAQSFAETVDEDRAGGDEAESMGTGLGLDSENFDPMMLSRAEIELLQSLHVRRKEIEDQERELELREKTLSAAEQSLGDKVDELKDLKKLVEQLLAQHDEEQESRLRSLVKIYENMKPKQAARIFKALEDEVRLDVLERMREAKSAPILALLDPELANQLTVDLVNRQRLPASDLR